MGAAAPSNIPGKTLVWGGGGATCPAEPPSGGHFLLFLEENNWKFIEVGNDTDGYKTEVLFDIDFEIENKFLKVAVARPTTKLCPFFSQALFRVEKTKERVIHRFSAICS